ncbi:MAG: thiolase family protein [Actinomycetota bacterium]|nr:thiolase family protein [Actinomycetota bacterium]
MREAVIVDAVRTPIGRGKPGGALSGWHAADLLGEVLGELVARTGVDPGRIDDVITGCVSQAGEQAFNIARHAVLAAGFPESVPATSVDRQCGSSQQALHFAAQGVMAGSYDIAVAAGVESMSRVPMFSSAMGKDPGGSRVAERYAERGGLVNQGISAEMIAARWGLDREDLDRFSALSHQRAARATSEGMLDREIQPINENPWEGPTGESMTADEGIRPETTTETLAGLRPAFYSDELAARYPELKWVVTAGGASQLSDGASAVLVMERGLAEQLGLRPRAAIRHMTVVGDDPILMLTGVIPATRRILERSGLSIGDIDAFEVNEAFAPVVLSWQKELGADLDRVNINGGAIANGHPLGASGAKLMTALLNVLEQTGGRFGLQTMCEGGGMANATIVERLD